MYVIDTSALIDLKIVYRRRIFPSIWSKIEDLIKQGELISPREVYRELLRGDDELVEWAKANDPLFIEPDNEQGRILGEILTRFPAIVELLKLGPHADPWCVALALIRTNFNPSSPWLVITQEKEKGPGSHKLPNVCRAYGLPTYNLLDFFEGKGWQF